MNSKEAKILEALILVLDTIPKPPTIFRETTTTIQMAKIGENTPRYIDGIKSVIDTMLCHYKQEEPEYDCYDPMGEVEHLRELINADLQPNE